MPGMPAQKYNFESSIMQKTTNHSFISAGMVHAGIEKSG
jgi:hypothetical protein